MEREREKEKRNEEEGDKPSLSTMKSEPLGEKSVVSPRGPESVKYIVPSESKTIELGP